ncbi:MAG: glycosyl hydrolase family 28-related protein [Thermosphaera sp.]
MLQPIQDPTKRFFDQVVVESSYIVFKEAGKVIAKNGKTGQIEFSDTDASTVIQSAIDASTGGVVYIKEGTYYITNTISLARNVRLVGSGETTVLKLGDGVNKDILLIPRYAINSGIERLRLDGNKANNTRGSCIKIFGFNWRNVIKHVTIRDVPEFGILATSETDEYTYEPIIFDVDIKGSESDGISLGFVADLWGANIYSEGNGGNGASLWDVAGTIYHLHVYNNYGLTGVLLSEYSNDIRLVQPHLDNNHGHGMVVKGKRNTIIEPFAFNNSRSEAGAYDGISLQGAEQTIIIGGIFTDFQQVKTQAYGIDEESGDYNLIIGCILTGNLIGGLRLTGANSRAYHNIGYRNANSGTATIPPNSTYVDVEHGLDVTPDINKIRIVPKDDLAGRSFWVSDVTRTTFRINISTPDTVSHSFGWSYEE